MKIGARTVPTEQEHVQARLSNLPENVRRRATAERPFEMRPVNPPSDWFHPAQEPPRRMVWLRTVAPLPEDPALHRYLLAYASDYSFLGTSLLPHGVGWLTPGMQVASIDHVMWFHRQCRAERAGRRRVEPVTRRR